MDSVVGAFLLGALCGAGLLSALIAFTRLPPEFERRIQSICEDMDDADRRARAAKARRERDDDD